MNTIDKFLENNSRLRGMLDSYLELRLYFQGRGFSQKDLERVKHVTPEMMSLHEKVVGYKNALFQQINNYGFNISPNKFNELILPLFNKIDEVTPLKENGNNERNDIGNEDY
jgi:hypothetical protein